MGIAVAVCSQQGYGAGSCRCCRAGQQLHQGSWEPSLQQRQFQGAAAPAVAGSGRVWVGGHAGHSSSGIRLVLTIHARLLVTISSRTIWRQKQ